MVVLIPKIQEHGGYPGNVGRYDIGDNCLVCGEKREVINAKPAISYDGSRRLFVEGWENKCGHTETYSLCREKGTPVPYNTISICEEPEPIVKENNWDIADGVYSQ